MGCAHQRRMLCHHRLRTIKQADRPIAILKSLEKLVISRDLQILYMEKDLDIKIPAQEVYDESKIKHLEDVDHIRLRPGMYIGKLGNGEKKDDGIYVLLKEIVDNAIDEFTMGHGKTIKITVDESSASVRDYGRGIPFGKLIQVVSVLNTGAKYDDAVFKKSVGLNGVGAKATNALSDEFYAVFGRSRSVAVVVAVRYVAALSLG